MTRRETPTLVKLAAKLADEVDKIAFSAPVTHVYNPLRHAWEPHCSYLRKCNVKATDVLFLGMNPGPWGMAQTGVPFGQIAAVRDWLGITGEVTRPDNEHPQRPIEGFACKKSEVSGARLWGLFRDRFGTADAFFARHFVVNYCPLIFIQPPVRNLTPDKLPAAQWQPLQAACDAHLSSCLALLRPQFLVGVGAFAETCLQRVAAPMFDATWQPRVVRILHPSPASPAANRDWSGVVAKQLADAGVWVG